MHTKLFTALKSNLYIHLQTNLRIALVRNRHSYTLKNELLCNHARTHLRICINIVCIDCTAWLRVSINGGQSDTVHALYSKDRSEFLRALNSYWCGKYATDNCECLPSSSCCCIHSLHQKRVYLYQLSVVSIHAFYTIHQNTILPPPKWKWFRLHTIKQFRSIPFSKF